MELKFVIPNMEETFGNLEFAGEDKVVQRRINGQPTVLSRSYNLYSDVQRADDIVPVLPAHVGIYLANNSMFHAADPIVEVIYRDEQHIGLGTRFWLYVCCLSFSRTQ